jgi:hypothetical protein
LVGLVRALPEASATSGAVGVGTIFIVRGLRRIAARAPGSLIALLVVGGAVAWLRPEGVAVLGPVPAGLPAPSFPVMPLGAWLLVLPVSLAIAALTIAEGVVLSQSEGSKHGEEIATNHEVFADGLRSMVASITVRNLGEEVQRRVRQRAAEHGRSMEAEVRSILAAAVSRGGLARAWVGPGASVEVMLTWLG